MQATIAQLWIYPIKSCAGTRLTSAQVLPTGLLHDRGMMVVDAATGRFLTQRSHPAMALIHPQIEGDDLLLKGLNQTVLRLALQSGTQAKTVTVWRDTLPAIDMGDAAALWLSTALNANVRLVRFDPAQQRRVKNSDVQTKLGDQSQTQGQAQTQVQTHQFADGYPFLILSKASLRALNERLAENGAAPVAADRFRANIILDDVDAHTEDFSETLLHASGALFTMQSPCTRCDVPTIDPETGLRNPQHEPSLTLAQYRYDKTHDGVTFGMNATTTITPAGQAVMLQQGDRLDVRLAF